MGHKVPKVILDLQVLQDIKDHKVLKEGKVLKVLQVP
jgi:hypothetical protein